MKNPLSPAAEKVGPKAVPAEMERNRRILTADRLRGESGERSPIPVRTSAVPRADAMIGSIVDRR